nr:unnamed protein product [Haemonchus contortus]
MPKPTLQTVSSNLDISESRRRLSELCSGRSSLKPHSSALQPSEDNAVLHEAENEAEYLQKLISRDHGGLSDIDEEDPIEFCGPESEPDNYDDIKTDAPLLTEDYHRFQYEKPDEDGLQTARKYTLEEMETLFDSVNEVLIF